MYKYTQTEFQEFFFYIRKHQKGKKMLKGPLKKLQICTILRKKVKITILCNFSLHYPIANRFAIWSSPTRRTGSFVLTARCRPTRLTNRRKIFSLSRGKTRDSAAAISSSCHSCRYVCGDRTYRSASRRISEEEKKNGRINDGTVNLEIFEFIFFVALIKSYRLC